MPEQRLGYRTTKTVENPNGDSFVSTKKTPPQPGKLPQDLEKQMVIARAIREKFE